MLHVALVRLLLIHNFYTYMYETFVRYVSGSGVYALRKDMARNLPRTGLIARAGHAFGRGIKSIRKFIFNKTSAAVVLAAGFGALCVAAGLANVLGGSLCAVAALGSAGLFRHYFGVAPFFVKPTIPIWLGSFLSTDFERTLDITKTMLGLTDAQPPQRPAAEVVRAATL